MGGAKLLEALHDGLPAFVTNERFAMDAVAFVMYGAIASPLTHPSSLLWSLEGLFLPACGPSSREWRHLGSKRQR